jgi:hypothetical protein
MFTNRNESRNDVYSLCEVVKKGRHFLHTHTLFCKLKWISESKEVRVGRQKMHRREVKSKLFGFTKKKRKQRL